MALVSEYQGFIFDYGGVLAGPQTEADEADLARLARIPKEDFVALYWAYRLDYDKALMTDIEYWQTVAQNGGASLSLDTIQRLVERDNESWMHFDPVMWSWIDQLRSAGKRVAMLSNMPRDLGEALKLKTDKLGRFDQVTLSYELHSAKPEPAIYESCLEGLGTAAAETLFLDDRIENVHGAEMLGIRAMQFVDRDAVLLKLRG